MGNNLVAQDAIVGDTSRSGEADYYGYGEQADRQANVIDAVSEWTPTDGQPITIDPFYATPIIIRWLDEEGNLLREQTVRYGEE